MRATLAQAARLTGVVARWACVTCLLLSSIAAPAAADYAAGLNAFNRKDYPKAFTEWIDVAKGGEAAAQHGVGMLYEMGAGVPYADPKAAADWYQKAADQQYAPAINNLARLYADGRGVAADPAKAIDLWSRAAAAGNNTARFNLGVQYANGAGVKKDEAKAAQYLQQAAEGGLAEAQFALAGFYRDGLGVQKDEGAARLWFQRAADAGLEPARSAIAAMDQAAKEAAAKPAEPAQSAAKPEEAAKAEEQTPPVNPAVPEQSAVDPTKPAEEAAAPKPEAAQKPAEPAADPAIAPAPPKPEEQPAAEAAQPPAPPAPEAPADSGEQAEAAHADAAITEKQAEDPAAEHAAVEQPGGEQTTTTAEEGAGGEGSAAMNTLDTASELPLAESLSGDVRVFRIWLYDSGQENDARSYWSKLTTQYPRLLKELKLDLRRYFLGEAKGSVYRVFAGPFDSFSAAQGACNQIRERFGDQFCRPVIN